MSYGHWRGVFNVLQIDTTPGGQGPFAPPAGWLGDDEVYRALLRDRYRDDRAAKQQMALTASLLGQVYTGPYAQVAREVIDSLRKQR